MEIILEDWDKAQRMHMNLYIELMLIMQRTPNVLTFRFDTRVVLLP